jgi:hypothetical protein
MVISRSKSAVLKYIGIKSKEAYLAQQLEDSGLWAVLNYDEYLYNRYTRIIDRMTRLERLARLEERHYQLNLSKEQAQLYSDYLEVSREYRALMSELFIHVRVPELIDEDKLRPLELIHDLIAITDKYNKAPDGSNVKELYKELLDSIIMWSQSILLTRHLSNKDIDKILDISLSESVDIHSYATEFPELFEASELPAEIFSEVMVFLAYSYAILNRSALPSLNECPQVIANYANIDDFAALKDMTKYLMENTKMVYTPAIITNPDDILNLNPELTGITVEYSENFISKGKATRFQTISVDTPEEWGSFTDRLQTFKDAFEETNDIGDAVEIAFPNMSKGIEVSNVLVWAKRGD